MDDMFSSYDESYTDPKLVKSLIETVIMEVENDDMNLVDNMIHLLSEIKKSITAQIVELKNDDFEQKTDDELIKLAVKEYEENLSFIDEIVEEKFKSSSN
jgi:predicted TIM-barrel fold metal-dependent hydrolase